MSNREGEAKLPLPKQYLYDRCIGRSKWGGHEEKPVCPMWYVPWPVYWCSPVLEQNRFCRFFGKIGLLDADFVLRRKIIAVGFVANVLAFLLTAYSCFAMATSDPHMLRAASFTDGVLKVNGLPTALRTDIGLRAVAVTDTNGLFEPEVISFDAFCERFQYSVGRFNPDAEKNYGACQSHSSGLVSSVIIGMIFLVPTINTDVTRSFKNYDVNCQKFFGGIVGGISACMSLFTLLSYKQNCFAAFYEGITPFVVPEASMYMSTLIENHPEVAATIMAEFPEDGIQVEMKWGPGPGLICTYIALALKCVDIVVNFLIPAPSIARDREEQMEYEQLNGREKNAISVEGEENEENDQEMGDKTTVPPKEGGSCDGASQAAMDGVKPISIKEEANEKTDTEIMGSATVPPKEGKSCGVAAEAAMKGKKVVSV
ncbi:hypothetical protein ACHAWF_015593 [Thalassiosira exigua]